MKLSHVAAIAVTSIAVAAIATLSSQEKEKAPEAVAELPLKCVERCEPAKAVACDAVDTTAPGKGHTRYRKTQTTAEKCFWECEADGGTDVRAEELRVKPVRKGMEILAASCVPVGQEGLGCACRKATGECQYRDESTGALVGAPMGKTLGPGYPPFEQWAGEGCQPKSCVELAGETSWPTVCPKR